MKRLESDSLVVLGNIYFMGELKASLKDKCEANIPRFLFPLTRIAYILFKYLETLRVLHVLTVQRIK